MNWAELRERSESGWPVGFHLICREVVANLIGAVTTKEGLTIQSALDENRNEIGRKVTGEEMESLSIERDTFHGEWNFTLAPRPLNDDIV